MALFFAPLALLSACGNSPSQHASTVASERRGLTALYAYDDLAQAWHLSHGAVDAQADLGAADDWSSLIPVAMPEPMPAVQSEIRFGGQAYRVVGPARLAPLAQD